MAKCKASNVTKGNYVKVIIDNKDDRKKLFLGNFALTNELA